VTRGQLPQRAGLLSLNGGGAAAAVPPTNSEMMMLWVLVAVSTMLFKALGHNKTGCIGQIGRSSHEEYENKTLS